MAEWLVQKAKSVLASEKEPLFLNIEDSDDDATHGILKTFLSALDEKLPKLTIVACAMYIDVEYGEDDVVNFLYSSEGSSMLGLDNFDRISSRADKLPDEDWIPYDWWHQGNRP